MVSFYIKEWVIKYAQPLRGISIITEYITDDFCLYISLFYEIWGWPNGATLTAPEDTGVKGCSLSSL